MAANVIKQLQEPCRFSPFAALSRSVKVGFNIAREDISNETHAELVKQLSAQPSSSNIVLQELKPELLMVAVICNGNKGTFLVNTQTVMCCCNVCFRRESKKSGITPTEFERHSGLGTAKKWRNSIKVDDGDGTLAIGRWLEQNNIAGPPSTRKGSETTDKRVSSASDAGVDGKGNLAQNAGKGTSHPNCTAKDTGRDAMLLNMHIPAKLRAGKEYQAEVPLPLPKPSADAYDAAMKKYGVPGPTEAEALEVATNIEKLAAEQLPRDAIDDVDDEVSEDVRVKVEPRPDRILRSRNRQVGLLQTGNNSGSGTLCEDSENQAGPSSPAELGLAAVRHGEHQTGSKRRALEEVGNQIADAESAQTRPPAKKQTRDGVRPIVSAWKVLQHENKLKVTVLVDGCSFSGVLVPTKSPLPPIRAVRGPYASNPLMTAHTAAQAFTAPLQVAPQVVVANQLLERHRQLLAAAAAELKRETTVPNSQPDVSMGTAGLAVNLADQKLPEMPTDVNVCALCHKPADNAETCDDSTPARVTEGLGPCVPVHPGASTHIPGLWVHKQCALWSPEVYIVGKQLCNIDSAVQRGAKQKCSRCNINGATVSCSCRRCINVFHLHCAREACCTFVPEPYTVTCTSHEYRVPVARVSADGQTVPSRSDQLSEELMMDVAQQMAAALTAPPIDVPPYGHPGIAGIANLQRAASNDGSAFGERSRSVRAVMPKNYADMAKGTALPPPQRLPSSNARARAHSHSGSVGLCEKQDAPSRANSQGLAEESEMDLLKAMAEVLASRQHVPVQAARHGPPSLTAIAPFAALVKAPGASATPAGPATQPGNAAPIDACPGSDGTRPVAVGTDMMEVDECELPAALLGGTTGQPGRAGRCAVCVIQRKGKCGTESAPKKCLRRQFLQLRKHQQLQT